MIYSSLVYSCFLVILKQYLSSVSSSSLGRRILSALISSSERMGCPLNGGKLDGWISMTWVTCMDRVMKMAYMAAGGYGIFLGGIDWLPWVRNAAEIQVTECG